MTYGYTKEVGLNYEEAVERTREELQKQCFGILTEIDVKATLKKKLDVDFDDYIILGACNPPYAYKTLQLEREIGLLLPCNVIVYRKDSKTFISAILPTKALGIVPNDQLCQVAEEVEIKLKAAVDGVAA